MMDPFVAWGIEAFGKELIQDPHERALRFLEEALELAQAMGVTQEVTGKIAERVYAGEPGPIVKEIGQASLTLHVLAAVIGLDATHLKYEEPARIRDKLAADPEHFTKHHARKRNMGIAA